MGLSALKRSAPGERIQVFSAKDKSGECGIKLNFTSSLSLEGGAQHIWFGGCVFMFNDCVQHGWLCLMYGCMSPPCTACAKSCLSKAGQPPVGEKKAGDVGEAREEAAASRSGEGEGQ